MTDTDKLKRLAEEALKYDPTGWREVAFKEPEALAILALIAENEGKSEQFRLLDEEYQAMRDLLNEAVALLRPLANMATVCGKGGDDSVYVGQSGIRLTYGDFRRAFAFLARIDGNHQPTSGANPLQSRL